MTTGAYVVLSFAVLCPWLAIIALAVHFGRAQSRLLRSNDDLTSQVIAFKNPGAAMLFAQQQAVQKQAEAMEAHAPHQASEFDEEMFG